MYYCHMTIAGGISISTQLTSLSRMDHYACCSTPVLGAALPPNCTIRVSFQFKPGTCLRSPTHSTTSSLRDQQHRILPQLHFLPLSSLKLLAVITGNTLQPLTPPHTCIWIPHLPSLHLNPADPCYFRTRQFCSLQYMHYF